MVDSKAIVQPESLDLTGKLKNMLMADCDAIGYVYRDDEKGKLKVDMNDYIKKMIKEFPYEIKLQKKAVKALQVLKKVVVKKKVAIRLRKLILKKLNRSVIISETYP